jgi:hypothetical protein
MALAGLCCVAWERPATAQVAAVLYGRVEDALTRQPLENVRVFAADSSAAVLTDSRGDFALPLGPGVPFVILTERLGYISQRFDLPADAPNRMSVLLLEPEVIALEGITVEVETALERLVQNLESRRNSFPGAIRVFDRESLNRRAGGGSVWDFVRQVAPWARECPNNPIYICAVGGGRRTFADPYPDGVGVLVCVDGWRMLAPTSDLASLSAGGVSLVEFFGREQIRVYTAEYLLARARRGSTIAPPVWMGC